MFRGSDGRVESSALAVQAPPEAPSALQYQQQQQYGQVSSVFFYALWYNVMLFEYTNLVVWFIVFSV